MTKIEQEIFDLKQSIGKVLLRASQWLVDNRKADKKDECLCFETVSIATTGSLKTVDVMAIQWFWGNTILDPRADLPMNQEVLVTALRKLDTMFPALTEIVDRAEKHAYCGHHHEPKAEAKEEPKKEPPKGGYLN
jgi:hypothetical protein